MSTISMNCRRAASFADAQRLSRLRRTHGVFSRLRRSLRKRTARSLFSAPYGKALQRQAKIFIQAKITVPPHVRNRRIKYRRPPTLGIPGGGGLTVIGKNPSLLSCHFRLFNRYSAMDAWRPSTKALTQSSRHNVSQDVQRLTRLRRPSTKALSQSSPHSV